MNPWYLLIPAFASFCIGSVATYSATIRNSWQYYPMYVGSMLACAFLWISASRTINDPVKILFYSLVWDCLMLLAYYAAPLVLKGHNLSWQAYAAAAVAVVGVVWFKVATEPG